MDLMHLSMCEQRAHPSDFLPQPGYVLIAALRGLGNDAIASTVEAGAAAKRHVHIQGKRPVGIAGVGSRGKCLEVGSPKVRAELRRSGIRRIPRSRAVVSSQHGWIGRDRMQHEFLGSYANRAQGYRLAGGALYAPTLPRLRTNAYRASASGDYAEWVGIFRSTVGSLADFAALDLSPSCAHGPGEV